MRYTANHNNCKGFTLIELVTTIALAGIVTVGVGVLLADSQKSWGTLSERVYGDSAIDNFAALKAFDTVCRKSSLRKHVISESGDSLELYYWDGASTSLIPENYARFYKTGSDVFVEHGKMKTDTWQTDAEINPSTLQIARNVESLKFTLEGISIQMYLNYTDPKMIPMVYSSVRHND